MSRLRAWATSKTRLFAPFRVARAVDVIDYEELWDLGVRGIVFDLENTLALYRGDTLLEGYVHLLAGLRDRGFSIAIVSNSARSWVELVATALGIPSVAKAGKPRARAFVRALSRLPVPVEHVVVVGDQFLTDVYGAQRLGLRAILVDPLGPEEPVTSRLQRRAVPLTVHAVERVLDPRRGRSLRSRPRGGGVGG